MIADHAFKSWIAAASDSQQRCLLAAVTGKKETWPFSSVAKKTAAPRSRSVPLTTPPDARSILSLSWLIFSARRCLEILADCLVFAGSRIRKLKRDHATGRPIGAAIGAGSIDEEALDRGAIVCPSSSAFQISPSTVAS